MRLLSLPKKTLNLLKKDGGKIFKDVAERGGVDLAINDSDVAIEGEGGTEWIVEQVLKALAYGFQPRQAFKLFSDDYFLEAIDLRNAFHGNEKKMRRYKARIIGQQGAAKKKLQELSGAFLAVGPEHIAILGEFEDLRAAKEAVLRLLEGSEHVGVYSYLEREKHRQKKLM